MPIEQKELDELKNLLLNQKARLEEELGRITRKSSSGEYETTFNEIGTDEDENASEVEEYTANLALESNLHGQLEEINNALEKIAMGTYGKCENCAAEIPVERLRVYPAAKTCLSCNEQ